METGDADPVEASPAATGVTVSPTAPVPAKRLAPIITPSGRVDLPETLRYRLKNILLGPPLSSDRQSSERLGKPTALAVLSSDVISSSAYATEQMLIPLVIAIGAAAYSLVIPVTFAVIFVLLFVTLSYLEVVKVYTKAGGAYVVTRENFGLTVAQVAAMSLLIDYTLTVAVSVAAGVAAITSVFPALTPDTRWIAIGLVILLAYGNLRGIREAGRTFAVPTYFFIANMVVLIVWGIYRAIAGTLHAHSIDIHNAQNPTVHVGSAGSGLLYGATLIVVLKAFASGGSALTGTEAISNGVSIFRRPESRNARITMVLMAVILGSLVLGVSVLASMTHPVPYQSGTPTVIYQVGKFVYGSSGVGNLFSALLQIGTTLILILAANTSFTGFPFLASFAAEDSYLPRQLTKRGHRLVFSTGIVVLTVVSVILLLVTDAKVDKLIPLYAIGVFTGFTMAGAGMAKYHLNHREENWRRRLAINGTASVLSFIVLVIIAVSKFSEGAWVILIILPLGVVGLLALHRQYADEQEQLEVGAAEAAEAPVLNRHVVVVLVDRLDMATARALQYARTLHPDELRAVHFTLDNRVAADLEAEWGRLGLTRLPLDVEECEDRRLTRSALELAAETVADGQTELTILLPRRGLRRRLAPAAARCHRRPDRRRRGPAGPRERHRGPLPAGRGVALQPAPLDAPARPWPGAGPPGGAGLGPGPGPHGRAGRGEDFLRTGRLRRARSRHHPDQPGGVAPPGPGGRTGEVGPRPTPGRHVQPRVRPGRRDGAAPPRLPGSAPYPGHPAGGPAGGRGNGRRLGPAPGHSQPRLRAGGRPGRRGGALLTAPAGGRVGARRCDPAHLGWSFLAGRTLL